MKQTRLETAPLQIGPFEGGLRKFEKRKRTQDTRLKTMQPKIGLFEVGFGKIGPHARLKTAPPQIGLSVAGFGEFGKRKQNAAIWAKSDAA